MKPSLALSVLVLLVATWLSPETSAAGEAANLIANGGFEDGTTGWTTAPEHSLVAETGANKMEL